MSSQSDADRILREHRALKDETSAIQREHAELESAPFDRNSHAVHKRRIRAHLSQLAKHAKQQRAIK
jgi:hypothetical protein